MDKDKIKETDRAIHNLGGSGDFYYRSVSAHAMSGIQQKWIEATLARIGSSSPRNTGLEIGCGAGDYLPWLAKWCDFIIGLDHSIRAARVASSRFSNNSDFVILVGDGEIVPLRDRSVDLIYCGSILHHLPEYSKSLANLFASLNENGAVVVNEPCAYNPFAIIRRKFFPSLTHTPDERPFPPKEIIAEFKRDFDLVYYKRFFIFSINASVVEQFLGKRIANLYLKISMIFDGILLQIPIIKDLCWRISLIGLKLSKSN
jgi:ubiquinone/menaquinone biosynthesis C-methylase UbiE